MSANLTSAQLMTRIETEYQQPAREVVAGYYLKDRLPVTQIAAILEINEKTLCKWLRQWGYQRAPGFVRGEVEGHVMRRARELGYRSLTDAVCSLRMTGNSWVDIARQLDSSVTTVVRASPQHIKGRGIVVLTAERRAAMREAGYALYRKRYGRECPR